MPPEDNDRTASGGRQIFRTPLTDYSTTALFPFWYQACKLRLQPYAPGPVAGTYLYCTERIKLRRRYDRPVRVSLGAKDLASIIPPSRVEEAQAYSNQLDAHVGSEPVTSAHAVSVQSKPSTTFLVSVACLWQLSTDHLRYRYSTLALARQTAVLFPRLAVSRARAL
ncbi:hypothetical protein BV20DRAFT_279872 [Pilatotrama ljubarskyi]|nr:hypothetical protein BV20DRAFT_279872 [Pilatotrama ljubarskyi]